MDEKLTPLERVCKSIFDDVSQFSSERFRNLSGQMTWEEIRLGERLQVEVQVLDRSATSVVVCVSVMSDRVDAAGNPCINTRAEASWVGSVALQDE